METNSNRHDRSYEPLIFNSATVFSFIFLFCLGSVIAVNHLFRLMGKARIGVAKSHRVTGHGKVVDGGSTRRPGPYSTRPRSSTTNSNEKSDEESGKTYDNPLIIPDESESDSGFEPDDDNGPVGDRPDLAVAANEDIWPEQFPAEFDMRVNTIGEILSIITG